MNGLLNTELAFSVRSVIVVTGSLVPEKFGVGSFGLGTLPGLSSGLLKHMTADPFFA